MDLNDNDTQLLAKVDWEGGIDAALDYGITADQFEDPELRTMWYAVQRAYNSVYKQRREINNMIDELEC